MDNGLRLIIGEDGVARAYDDTYDITIHCESAEEQDQVRNILTRQWTPVKERLPEEDGCYLVTDHNGEVVRYVFHRNESSMEFWYRTVVAWMPQPEPYKEGQE